MEIACNCKVVQDSCSVVLAGDFMSCQLPCKLSFDDEGKAGMEPCESGHTTLSLPT